MNYCKEIHHLRWLSSVSRLKVEQRNKVVSELIDTNYPIFNMLSWLEVCRTEAATDYHTAVANGSDAAYETLKVLQIYDNDHRTAMNALRDLAHLLMKYKDEVQKEYRPPEVEEPAWMKDA